MSVLQPFFLLIPLLTSLPVPSVPNQVACTLKHSAVAELDEDGSIDVHATDNDSIPVRISGLGQKEAVFNDTYQLSLMKKDSHGLYYSQPTGRGLIIWAYFPETHTLTYAKLRAFPVTNLPSSYLMICKCE